MELNFELYQFTMAILFVGIVLLLHFYYMVKRDKKKKIS